MLYNEVCTRSMEVYVSQNKKYTTDTARRIRLPAAPGVKYLRFQQRVDAVVKVPIDRISGPTSSRR